MRPLLDLFNKYEHPDVEDMVHVILGREGEVFVTVRPVEALVRFAEVNGCSSVDEFLDKRDDDILWSKDYHRGELNGTVIETVPLEGYYRDGRGNL